MTKRMILFGALVVALSLAVGGAALAEAKAEGKGEMKAPAKTSKMQPQLDRLKKLSGEWFMKGGDGNVAVVYKVTGAGSAVVETLFPGSDHEMVTVYTLDGDSLLLTHYCAAGNAPTMKATPGGPANEIRFKFLKATNLASSGEGHMHDATMVFVNDDTLKTDWVFWEGGKTKSVEKFEFTRKK